MTIKLENVGIAVRDIDATIAFFTDLGLTLLGEDTVSGEWAETAVGLDGNHARIAVLQTPDGSGQLELFEYIHPDAIETQPTRPNDIGMHRVAFTVDDLDAALEIAARHDCHPLRGVATAFCGGRAPCMNSRAPGAARNTVHEHSKEDEMRPDEITEVLTRTISRELLDRDITRLAYVAKDGTPRNVPIAFAWNGTTVVMCTAKNAPKLHALSANPHVALTIDTEAHPPKILLIRGRVELDHVDGIPEEYLQTTSTYQMTPEQRVEWETGVRSLYHEGMVRIVVTPTWVKLIDFETTLPSAVAELIEQQQRRQGT